MGSLTFQEIIMRLDQFWAGEGCLITEPYDVEVGAATSTPDTFLRVLGPEPWWVAYTQASRRPADGRYAENPNRYQRFFQYQVILKPGPPDPLGLYLKSLEALGVSDRDHEVRFVEDNWESPSLGAWGLGWEVWLDGLEITQFTYFQQCGGLDLVPPAVEITYGLERLAMYLQGARDFVDIRWNERVTYGELYRQSEIQHCTYNFELADVDALRTEFELFEREANRTIEVGLLGPALELVMKCSHSFNLLDARGAVGVVQRASYMARMRTLARRIALAYVAQREELGYPLKGPEARGQPSPTGEGFKPAPTDRADFLLEVGVEELPAGELTSAIDQLREAVPEMLAEAGLESGPVLISGTPRRLVVEAHSVGVRAAVREEIVRGPPVSAAYDAEGRPTRAAEGFARGAGVGVDDLERQELAGRTYVVARRQVESRLPLDTLAGCVAELLGRLRFGRPMYWQTPDVVFSRPIRWLLALWGDEVVPGSIAGVAAGRLTFPPRGAPQEPIAVPNASGYAKRLREIGVMLDVLRRQTAILERGRALAAEVGGTLDEDPALLEEVANLVEWPEPLLGRFEADYLQAPQAALVTVMRKHQRYFPIRAADGSLLPHFVVVANGRERSRPDLIVSGNEEVLRARFADALFFYRLDLRRPLADYVPDLARLTFLEGLGSMLDKTERLEALCPVVAGELGIAGELLARAARLAKADLATNLVRELTELQGEMGREYALRSGEPPEVADAIAEHYRPRYGGDAGPRGELALALGITDRIDTLVAGFAAGLEPTGSSDPFGLRRVALGLIGTLIERCNPASLERLTSQAAERSPLPLTEERRAALRAFLQQRLRVLLIDQGRRPEVVDAVLEPLADRPSLAASTAAALEQVLDGDSFQQLVAGVKRADRIVPKGQSLELRRDALVEPAELALLEAYDRAAASVAELRPDDVARLVRAMAPLAGPVDRFFTDVLVMVDDPTLRESRLALLQRIRDLPARSFEVGKLASR